MRTALTLLALLPAAAGAAEIPTDAGTLQLGGAATLDIYAGGGTSDVGINLAPQAGYFIVDQLELLGSVGLFINNGTSFSIGLGANYFIPLGDPQLYLGGTFGYSSINIAGTNSGSAVLTPQGGVILPVADNVGIDLGVRIHTYLNDPVVVHVPAGYFGVQGFIPTKK